MVSNLLPARFEAPWPLFSRSARHRIDILPKVLESMSLRSGPAKVSGTSGFSEGPQDPRILSEVQRFPDSVSLSFTYKVSDKLYESLRRRIRGGVVCGVAARVMDAHGRVLLVRQTSERGWSTRWMTPGGGVEPDEPLSDAVEREIWEEAGVRVTRLRLWKALQNRYLPFNGSAPPVSFPMFQYTALWKSGRPHSNVPDEIGEVRWFLRLPAEMEFRDDWLRPPARRLR